MTLHWKGEKRKECKRGRRAVRLTNRPTDWLLKSEKRNTERRGSFFVSPPNHCKRKAQNTAKDCGFFLIFFLQSQSLLPTSLLLSFLPWVLLHKKKKIVRVHLCGCLDYGDLAKVFNRGINCRIPRTSKRRGADSKERAREHCCFVSLTGFLATVFWFFFFLFFFLVICT